jgi:hypothetical protein
MQSRATSGLILREALLALLVVALVFLNFGHVAVQASGELHYTAESWCGAPAAPDSPAHAPCHACRIGQGADLPPPCGVAEPVLFATTPVVYAAPALDPPAPQTIRPALARGPPALV